MVRFHQPNANGDQSRSAIRRRNQFKQSHNSSGNSNSNSSFSQYQPQAKRNVTISSSRQRPNNFERFLGAASKSHENQKQPRPPRSTDGLQHFLNHCDSMTMPEGGMPSSEKHMAQVQPRVETRQHTLSNPPLDFSLKTRLTILSTSSLAWSKNISFAAKSAALHNFGKQSADRETLDTATEFEMALLYYCYPSEVLDDAHLESVHRFIHSENLNLSTSDSNPRLLSFRGRVDLWVKAFLSLYFEYRNRECNCLYVVSPHFLVLFIWIEDTPHVVVTHAQRGLKHLLRKQNVPFTTPLGNTSDDAGDEDLDDAQKENQDPEGDVDMDECKRNGIKVKAAVKKTEDDSGRKINDTVLLISGVDDVHSFFDSFVNYVPQYAFSSKHPFDVPQIISKSPFLHSTLNSLRVTRNMEGESPDGSYVFAMEMEGPILPSSLVHLCRTLEMSQEQFDVKLEPHMHSLGLNCVCRSLGDISEFHHSPIDFINWGESQNYLHRIRLRDGKFVVDVGM